MNKTKSIIIGIIILTTLVFYFKNIDFENNNTDKNNTDYSKNICLYTSLKDRKECKEKWWTDYYYNCPSWYTEIWKFTDYGLGKKQWYKKICCKKNNREIFPKEMSREYCLKLWWQEFYAWDKQEIKYCKTWYNKIGQYIITIWKYDDEWFDMYLCCKKETK